MLVIRLKTDNTVIKSFGNCKVTEEQPYPLGEFDETLFEQVELEALPANWTQYKEKPQAIGSDFVQFIHKTFTEQNRAANKPIKERMIMAHTIPAIMENWHLDDSNTVLINITEFIEKLEEVTQDEWTEFLQTVEDTKGFNGNNTNGIGDQLIGLANQWADTVKFEN